ncbi:scavenger receptor cysteine-rich type 1 protein M160 [Patella vulgata]|uniref:scavenger receptor cysteine-rich type 1 protein M160 n=1 Tax=Patella vulgata TaxID=6465 RepID=UPI0024A9ADE2|nr:scavenger receptor cysteine-rich type 1 protein M160 [Patella vulgata]
MMATMPGLIKLALFLCLAAHSAIVEVDSQNADKDGDVMVTSDDQVLVFYYGMWGTICGYQWSKEDARVVCRQSGYEHGISFVYTDYTDKPIWLYTVDCTGEEDNITLCNSTKIQSNKPCPYRARAGVICYNNDSLNEYRLVGGENSNSGLLQVKYNNTWAYLCAIYSEYLICTELGYITGERYNTPQLDNITGNYWRNTFNCHRGEPYIDLCIQGKWQYISGCYSGYRQGVYCYGPVRLSTKYMNSSGAVLVYDNDRYKTVCEDSFDQNAVNVVCMQLGFSSGGHLLPGNVYLTLYSMINKRYNCTGDEASLLDCVTETTTESCSSAVIVSCTGDDTSTDQADKDGDVMVTSDDQVLIFYYGMWGTICGYQWSKEDARVVCRQSGYEHGISFVYTDYTDKPIWLYTVDCTGEEDNITLCNSTKIQSNKPCPYRARAGVICYNNDSLNEYRLVGGENSNSGLLQVKYNNTWAYLCAIYSEYLICTELGYITGERYNTPQLDNITGNYWRNTFNCHRGEPYIDLCLQGKWQYISGCYSGYRQGVYCYGPVRLSTKYMNSSGAVLVYDNDRYKTVCEDSFDQNAVNVVCMQLGFSSGGHLLPGNVYLTLYSMINKRYNCTGDEASLLDCVTETTTESCSSAVIVSCTGDDTSTDQADKDGDVMVTSDDQVLVFYYGMWGTICGYQWSKEDARVVCRQSGYEHGISFVYTDYTDKPIWLYTVDCTGEEDNITLCNSTKIQSNKPCPSYRARAGVICYNNDSLNEYRLVGGENSNSGLLQVKYNNTWAYLCAIYSEYLICTELGYITGERYNTPQLDNITGNYWRNTFNCHRGEPYIDLCIQGKWQYISGCYSGYRQGVYCYGPVRLSTKYMNSSGAVLVYDNDRYKTVCEDSFDQNAVNVVCMQLGFSSGGHLLPGNVYLTLYSMINKRYNCTGDEASLLDCVTETTTESCSSAAVIVSCTGDDTSTDQVDGGWSDWGSFSGCSVTCGLGIRSRSRECNNPTPVIGGSNCIGISTDTEECISPEGCRYTGIVYIEMTSS